MSPRLWTALRLGIGLAVILFLLAGFDPAAIADRLGRADYRLVAIGVVGLTAVHGVAALTWRSICARLAGVRLPWSTTLRAYYAAQALGGVTPANLGGDAYRVVALRSAGHGWQASVASVVLQRATSYLALAALALGATAVLAASTPLAPGLVAGGVAVSLAVGLAAAALLAPPRIMRGHWDRLAGLLGAPRFADEAAPQRARVQAAGIGLVLGLVFHAASVLLTWLLVVAVEPSAATLGVTAAVVVARLSLAVPISPSGLGIQEGVLSLLLASLGFAPQVALAGLLLSRLSLVTTTIIGAAALVAGHRPLPGPIPGQSRA
ncbi:MAG: flippase-like domain-containing protein [Chloroflexota bacterium]|nr:flippase-like domain-containing protein [Chloroflexota bacterium]